MRVELHPVYRVHIHLNKFCNIDLTSRGYYQIRLTPRNSNEYNNLDIKLAEKAASTYSSTLLPSSVINGVAASNIIEVLYADEVIELDDNFSISMQFTPEADFRTPKTLFLDLELWYMDRDRPPQYELLHIESKRTIEIELNPARLTTVSRIINFEYLAPSSLHFTVFASLVSILPRRRKPPPDPPLTQRLHELHEEVCTALMSSTESVEHFVNKNTHHLGSCVQFARSRSSSDMAALSNRLQASERPWATLEASVVQLSTQLDVLFDQLVELFGKCSSISQALLQDFLDQRVKSLGEGFFFSEKPLSALTESTPSTFIELNNQVEKSRYLHKMPRSAVFCTETDAPIENCPIIFEECYGASGPSTSSRNVGVPAEKVMGPAGDVTARKKRAKSFRLLNFRRKSAEPPHRMTHRSSVDSAIPENHRLKSPPLSERIQRIPANNEHEPSSSKSKEVTIAPDPIKINLLVGFVREREALKGKLQTKYRYEGNLYSELAFISVRPQCFALKVEDKRKSDDFESHLIVMIHGLEGTKDDLLPYRNALKGMGRQRTFDFLMSHANSMQTWADFETMSKNLLQEIKDHISYSQREPQKISFVAHSMGGIIVRAALGLPDASFLFEKLHTIMTINTPHLGLAYAGKGIQWGVQLVRWWKQSRSMDQLALRDETTFQRAFLVRLAQNKALGRFRNVLLVGSPDLLVPSHSSLLEPCKNSAKDPSALGTAFRDMLSSIYSDLISDDHPRTVVRYSTFHNNNAAKAARLTGRAAHIAPLEDDIFIEKLFSISALRYFTEN